jgi:hypothetical protein
MSAFRAELEPSIDVLSMIEAIEENYLKNAEYGPK